MKPLEKKHLRIQILRQNNEDRNPSYHVPFLWRKRASNTSMSSSLEEDDHTPKGSVGEQRLGITSSKTLLVLDG